MRKLGAFLLVSAMLLTTGACTWKASAAQNSVSPLRVSGGALVDKKGHRVVLRGMSSHGLGWYPRYINAAAMKTLKAYGANVIRLALYSETEAGYLQEPYSVDMLYIGIENAIAEDMYVIVDWHILGDGNPLIHAEAAEEFFSQISCRYAGVPNILYEICNEPNGDADWDDITDYASRIIPVIRENAPEAVVLVGTPEFSSQIQIPMQSPLPYENLMYSYHRYVDVSPDAEKPSMYWMEEAVKADFPVFLSEWGITYGEDFPKGEEEEATLLEQYQTLNMEVAQDFADYLSRNGISWCGWSLSNSVEIHSAIRWDCDKLHGWEWEDLTPGGELMFSAFKGKVSR